MPDTTMSEAFEYVVNRLVEQTAAEAIARRMVNGLEVSLRTAEKDLDFARSEISSLRADIARSEKERPAINEVLREVKRIIDAMRPPLLMNISDNFVERLDAAITASDEIPF